MPQGKAQTRQLMTQAALWNGSIFQNNKSISLVKSHGAGIKIGLAVARRGGEPWLNSSSGCESSPSHVTIFGAIPTEIGTSCSQYPLSAFSFVLLAPS